MPRFPSQSHNSPKVRPSVRTPLLMPPPTSLWARTRHQISLYQHYTRAWVSVNIPYLELILRLMIFAAKIASITKPCGRFAPRQSIWWPLIGFAAFDLSSGQQRGLRASAAFASLHVLVLFWALRFSAGGLCAGGGLPQGFSQDWNKGDG
jgi:hypothetical protein